MFEITKDHAPVEREVPLPNHNTSFLNGTVESIRCYKNDSGWAAVTV